MRVERSDDPFDEIQNSFLNYWNNLNNFNMLKVKKRPLKLIPIYAYNQRDWFYFFSRIYYQMTGESYSYYDFKNEMSCLTLAYKKVFVDKKWGAKDFCNFLYISLKRSIDSIEGRPFTLRSFKNSHYVNYYIDKFDVIFEKRRSNDFFEHMIYMPYFKINRGNKDLLNIFEHPGINFISFCFNYGIPIYCKCLQIEYNITIDESVNIFKKRLRESFSNISDKDLRYRLMIGFLKRSVCWEPYSSVKYREKVGENNIVFNWREDKEISNIIQKVGAKNTDWWREKHQMYPYRMLNGVEDIFKLKECWDDSRK